MSTDPSRGDLFAPLPDASRRPARPPAQAIPKLELLDASSRATGCSTVAILAPAIEYQGVQRQKLSQFQLDRNDVRRLDRTGLRARRRRARDPCDRRTTDLHPIRSEDIYRTRHDACQENGLS